MVEESLRQLTEERTLVIYCGAGVTKDRTGLGWNDLVLSVLDECDNTPSIAPEEFTAVRTLLEGGSIDARKKASIVCRAAEVQDETAFLSPILEKLLYAENGWQEGYILRNVARLALGLSLLGRKVRLITTNYDDYIERAIRHELDDWRRGAGMDLPVPGFSVKDINNVVLSRIDPINDATLIQLVYIHGRKAQGVLPNGHLVFSENSYAKNRSKEIETLIGQFNPDATLLVVGASFDDEPLVEALIRTKSEDAKRYGLLVSEGRTAEERKARRVVDRLRGDHLGIQILSPDSFAQVAQYIEELRIFMALCNVDAMEHYFESFSYGKRLSYWWEQWSSGEWHADHDAQFKVLNGTVRDLQVYFESNGIHRLNEKQERTEVLKLEAWIREDPSVRRDNRHLTHWANSIGPLRTTEAFRRERISPGSSIAAVAALLHGRPMLLSLSDLGFEAKASRWQSYLAVPIFVETVHEIPEELRQDTLIEVAGTVPVAVMCLASTLPIEANNGATASFADPLMHRKHYRELVAHLIGAGRSVSGIRVHPED